jgi:hypothetical protein
VRRLAPGGAPLEIPEADKNMLRPSFTIISWVLEIRGYEEQLLLPVQEGIQLR